MDGLMWFGLAGLLVIVIIAWMSPAEEDDFAFRCDARRTRTDSEGWMQHEHCSLEMGHVGDHK